MNFRWKSSNRDVGRVLHCRINKRGIECRLIVNAIKFIIADEVQLVNLIKEQNLN